MVIDKNLLDLLRCPQEFSPLAPADGRLLESINQKIVAGQIFNLDGVRVEQPIENGLLNGSEKLLYPIVQNIPALLPGEAIALDQLDN